MNITVTTPGITYRWPAPVFRRIDQLLTHINACVYRWTVDGRNGLEIPK